MVTLTTTDLVQLLRDSLLLEPAQLEELAAGRRDADADSLAAELVRRGWLTRYQAEEVLQGRGDQLVLGSYVLLEPLGQGGMGQVFKARHLLMNRLVAVKLIRPELLSHPETARRFRREMQAAAQLSHPHIVAAYDAEQVGDRHFLVMEYCAGVNLSQLVRDTGPLPVEQACDYVRQAALGLQHAFERGFVHRDIKPENLLVTPTPGPKPDPQGAGLGSGVIKILDMGLARVRLPEPAGPDSRPSQEGMIAGTPDFLAPEQARRPNVFDIRSDIYSLGCTFYYLLAGQVPYPGGTAMEKLLRHQLEQPLPLERLRPEVPAAVLAMVRRMMAKNPAQRFGSPAEVAAALEALSLQGHSTVFDLPMAQATVEITRASPGMETAEQEPDSTGLQLQPRPASRRRTWLLLAGAGLALALTAAGYFGLSYLVHPTSPASTDSEPSHTAPKPLEEPMTPVFVSPNERPVQCLAFAPDSRTLAVGFSGLLGEPVAIKVWDVIEPRELAELLGHKGHIVGVAFAPDRNTIASVGLDRTVRLWDLETGEQRFSLEPPTGGNPGFHSLAVSPDGKTLATGDVDGEVQLWDLATYREQGPFTAKHTGWVTRLAFSPDGRLMVTGSWDNAIKLWDWARREELGMLRGFARRFQDLALAPDGNTLVSTHTLVGTEIRLWDVRTRQLLQVFEPGVDVHCIRFSPDGAAFLTGNVDGTVKVWDAATGELLQTIEAHSHRVVGLEFSPDGRLWATASHDRTFKVWPWKGVPSKKAR